MTRARRRREKPKPATGTEPEHFVEGYDRHRDLREPSERDRMASIEARLEALERGRVD